MTNLVHQEIACTRQIEVTCTEPSTSGLFIRNSFGGWVRIVAELSACYVATCIIDPNRPKSNLRVRVRFRSCNGSTCRNIIWKVGGITVFDSTLSLRIGVRLQFYTQLVRTVHNTSLAVGTVRTTGGQNHRDSISRKNRTGINVTTVRAHQSVHVPVAIINVWYTVQYVITSRRIVLIGTVSTTLIVITRTGVSIASFMGIIPGTSIGIHCIVADTHTVALAQECLDSIIGFTGKVGFLIDANTPTN